LVAPNAPTGSGRGRRDRHSKFYEVSDNLLLYGELRYVYQVPKDQATERLDAWLAWASRSRLKPFVKLARTIHKHKQGVLAAIELEISNGRLEALNSKVRLISHRAHGFHSAAALIAMIYLCCAGIQIPLPHR